MDDESKRLAEILRKLSRSDLLLVRALLLAGVHLRRVWNTADRNGRLLEADIILEVDDGEWLEWLRTRRDPD